MSEADGAHWPLIRRVGKDGSLTRGDLADTLAALSNGEVDHFPALRTHQADPWHILTVQLAVLATEAIGASAIPTTVEEWRNALLALTPEHPGGEPWRMVVEDPSLPAFMQPPVTDADMLDKKGRPRSVKSAPDQIDTIVSGMSHEVKNGVILDAEDDDWIFALATLQTSQGSLGAKSLAVSRINGGYASRNTMRIVPPGGASETFLRDVKVLLRERAADPTAWAGKCHPLLWLRPFATNLEMVPQAFDLDPLYVEVCRRVRLHRDDGTVTAWVGDNPSTPSSRSERGVTRCPWTPIVRDEDKPKSYTPNDQSDWRVVSKLLDPAKVDLPLLAQVHPEDVAGCNLRIAGLRRGQGATSRFELIEITVPAGGDGPGAGMEAYAVGVTNDPANDAWDALRRSLIAAAQNATEKIRFEHAPSVSWADGGAPAFHENLADVLRERDMPTDAESRASATKEAARRTFEERVAMLPGSTTPKVVSAIARAAGRLEAALGRRKETDEQPA